MRVEVITLSIAAAVVVPACGGAGDSPRAEFADQFIDLAADEGIVLDRGCVVEAAEGLSESDADALLDAGSTDDPTLSADAEAIGREMLSRVEVETYLDGILEQFEADRSIDLVCLRDALGGLATVADVNEQAADAARACSS